MTQAVLPSTLRVLLDGGPGQPSGPWGPTTPDVHLGERLDDSAGHLDGGVGKHTGAQVSYTNPGAPGATSVAAALDQLFGAGGTQADLIFSAATRVVIAAGVATVTQAAHTIDGEGDAADTLVSIAGGTSQEVIFVRADDPAGAPITIQHGTGANQIACPGGKDIVLDNASELVLLYNIGTRWVALPGALTDGGALTAASFDLNGLEDHDFAATGAVIGKDIDGTINHATADAVGVDSSVAQLTTPRTAGTVSAHRGRTTSLAGDTGGVYADYDASGNTDGGGAARHVGLLVDGTVDDAVASAPSTAGGAAAATAGVGLRSGARTKTDADAGTPGSGNVELRSGAAVVAAAAVGGASGSAVVGSGDTDSTDAGGTGGDSGAVRVASGAANSTAGTSGNTGDVEVRSGNSADGDSGDVFMFPGTAPGGTPGAVGFKDAVDSTKEVVFDVSPVATGTRRTVAMPDRNVSLDRIADEGSVASWRLLMANVPTDGDTVTIGADVYEFVDTTVNLLINASDPDGQHDTIFLGDGVTPALANGTEDVTADVIGTTVRVRSAVAPGGAVVAADPSIVLAEAITDAADIWDCGNVNVNTLAGRAKTERRRGIGRMAVTAAMITNGARVDFAFTPTIARVQVESAAGAIRGNGADTYVIGNNGVLIAFGGGAAPDIQATDIVTIEALE